jgi:predicted DNA-binding protein (UPF0251 family)
MGRNCKSRHVQFAPAVKGFRPFGRMGGNRENVILSVDEFEAIRLLDYQHLNQEEAAVQMQVSRSTLTRIYEKARIKFAKALVEGCNLLIEGGDILYKNHSFHCNVCNHNMLSEIDTVTSCPNCNSTDINSLDDCTKNQCNKCRKCYQGGRHGTK